MGVVRVGCGSTSATFVNTTDGVSLFVDEHDYRTPVNYLVVFLFSINVLTYRQTYLEKKDKFKNAEKYFEKIY